MNELALLPNPFDMNVVQDAWQVPADVPSIHDAAFAQCLTAFDNVMRGTPDSVLIYGPAGAGKTHLLSRLQRHLISTSHQAPDHVQWCVFVSVKLQTSSQSLWQFLRRRLAMDLQRRHEGVTQLQRLVAHQIAAARRDAPRQWVRAIRVLPGTGDEAVTEYLEHVGERLHLGHDLYVTLEHLIHDRYILDATAWLRGDSLPESVLERLGLGREETENGEEAARRVVTDLCRLAGETLPIVFCFDQIEALQSEPDDRIALFRFGRVAADLAEADDNVLVISCIQSAMLDLLNASVREADRDRIFRRRAVLAPLVPPQVEALLRSRLDSGDDELQKLRGARQGQPLYPLDGRFVAELAQVSPCVPRRVLAAAATEFERLRSGRQAEPPDLDRFIERAFAERRTAALAHVMPDESRDTLLHGLPLAWSIRSGVSPSAAPATPGTRGNEAVDLVLRPPEGSPGGPPVGIAVCNETNATSLALRLKRLVQQEKGTGAAAVERIVVVRDARLGVPRTAKKTREYLTQLERRGARLIQPSAEALAALEALRSLLSDARAGDLARAGEAVAESAVCAWLKRNLDGDLDALLEEIQVRPANVTAASDEELVRDLGDLMLRCWIGPLDRLAQELSQPPEAVLAAARRHPDRFGLLHGPPVVLFVHVPAEALAREGE